MNSKSQLANDGARNGKRYGPFPRPSAASLAAGLAAATIASVVMAAASPEGPTPASSSFPAWLASAILSSLAILAVLSRYEREVRNLSLDRDSLEGRLLRASEETDRALRMRSQFLVEVSQEIRTPMNGVLRFAEVLQRTDLPPEQARHVDTIAHSGRAMMAILDDILDLARIEADDFSPQEHPVNVARLVEECVGVHRTSVARHGLKLGLRIDSRTPGSTITDALLLRRIVGYLLAEATPRVDDAGMKISLDFETGTFRLTVGDFEMPEGQVRHGAGSPPPLTASTGIGLSIAERMAKILGGSLETEVVEANLEAFVLRLPYRAADPARLPERRAHRHEQALRYPGAARVLLAADGEAKCATIRAMLERCNLTVDTACDGDEAVDLVLDAENSDRAYDLVLMDVQLPCCDGYEATRAIRLAGISHHHLPVIAITARTGPEDIALVRKAGMQAYLTQPIAFAELAAALRRWLPHRVVGEDRDANPRPENKASLEERWRARREQALQATREAAERAAMDEESTVRLAGLMHGLANCAALLGEEDLGRIAGRLEIALRSGADVEIRRRLAHELLQRAGPTLETAP